MAITLLWNKLESQTAGVVTSDVGPNGDIYVSDLGSYVDPFPLGVWGNGLQFLPVDTNDGTLLFDSPTVGILKGHGTISFHCKWTADIANRSFFSTGITGAASRDSGSHLRFSWYNPNLSFEGFGGYVGFSAAALVDGTWYKFGLTWDFTQIAITDQFKFYIGNVQQIPVGSSGPVSNLPDLVPQLGKFCFGSDGDTGSGYYYNAGVPPMDRELDNLVVWDDVLTDFSYMDNEDPGGGSALAFTTVSPLTTIIQGKLNTVGSPAWAFGAIGGTPPYDFARTGGDAWPNGIVLETTGEGTGTATEKPSPDRAVEVTVTDAVMATAVGTFTAPVSKTTIITPIIWAAGIVGAAYDSGVDIVVTGGESPYGLICAALAALGLVMNPTTGRVTGTPTGSHSGTVAVVAEDANGITDTVNVTLTIAAVVVLNRKWIHHGLDVTGTITAEDPTADNEVVTRGYGDDRYGLPLYALVILDPNGDPGDSLSVIHGMGVEAVDVRTYRREMVGYTAHWKRCGDDVLEVEAVDVNTTLLTNLTASQEYYKVSWRK